MVKKYDIVHYEDCDHFEDFIKKLNEGRYLENKGQWIFRGHVDATWNLETSIERAYKNFGIRFSQKSQIEINMVREFRRRSHQYITNMPNDHFGEIAYDEWMAHMQHHGAPTRLLDFSYSPYVASYFAFEAAPSNSKVAIWAFNTQWHRDKLNKKYPNLFSLLESYRKNRRPKDFNKIFMSNKYRLVLATNPFRLNERLTYQRGVFVCPGDIKVTFMKNLSDFGDNSSGEKPVIKFEIPTTDKNGSIRDSALNKLDIMNINRITLFPGLDGFAQSFAARIPSLFRHQSDYGVR